MIENNLEELLHIYDQPLYIESQHALYEKSADDAAVTKVLVVLKADDMNSVTEAMLLKMLAACGLQEFDYKIVKTEIDQVIQVINFHEPETVLLFGLNLASDSFSIQKERYKPFRFAGRKWLMGDSLVQIANTPALKSSLWTSGLKILFNIA